MAYDQKTYNAGAKYGETWTDADYSNKKTRSAYGSTNITLEENIGEDRMSKLSKYRQEKITNRSEVNVQRELDDEQRKVDRGTGKSAREIRQGNRQRRRELRQIKRTNRRNARNN